jgi:hypothetical protein
MIRQHEGAEQPISQELVDKAVAHLAPLYRTYVQEENAQKAERFSVQLGRMLVDYEHSCGFNPDFMPLVAERVQELVPESEYDVESVFAHMRRQFFDILGYFVASKRHDVMHELLNDKALDVLEEEGFFEMLVLERALEFEDDEEDEDEEDYEEEDECCADEDEECECYGCSDEDEDDEEDEY